MCYIYHHLTAISLNEVSEEVMMYDDEKYFNSYYKIWDTCSNLKRS